MMKEEKTWNHKETECTDVRPLTVCLQLTARQIEKFKAKSQPEPRVQRIPCRLTRVDFHQLSANLS